MRVPGRVPGSCSDACSGQCDLQSAGPIRDGRDQSRVHEAELFRRLLPFTSLSSQKGLFCLLGPQLICILFLLWSLCYNIIFITPVILTSFSLLPFPPFLKFNFPFFSLLLCFRNSPFLQAYFVGWELRVSRTAALVLYENTGDIFFRA